MSYSEQFFQLYAEYLKEPTVRAAHDWVFKIAGLDPAFEKVLDLGCGMCQEWLVYGPPCEYRGVDVVIGQHPQFVTQLNYRGKALEAKFTEATAFVSLFSSEITDTPKLNSCFYRSLFYQRPALQAGLVSGFYYTDMRDQNPVRETGGIWSYQTLHAIEEHSLDPELVERRIVLPVPSKLFGPNVIEVWRFFDRR